MMDTRDEFTFGDLALQATVRRRGGELVSLRSHGREVLWSGDAPWRRQSPVLFPIVGKLAGDTAHIDGRDYRIGQHGFARDMDFAWLECRDAECQLELRDTEETRAMFPYAFRLVIGYHVVHGELIVRYRLVNPDPVRRLHASLGAHPAFIWPLAPDVPRDGHFIEFERNEMSPIGRVEDGLLSPKRVSNPVSGKHLALSDALFAHDALIFDHVQSSGLTYRGGGYGLTIRWEHFRQLGIWTKPGAGFLCIEPWHGFSSPAGFDGPFEEKPGLLHLAPGHSWEASWSVQSRDRPRG